MSKQNIYKTGANKKMHPRDIKRKLDESDYGRKIRQVKWGDETYYGHGARRKIAEELGEHTYYKDKRNALEENFGYTRGEADRIMGAIGNKKISAHDVKMTLANLENDVRKKIPDNIKSEIIKEIKEDKKNYYDIKKELIKKIRHKEATNVVRQNMADDLISGRTVAGSRESRSRSAIERVHTTGSGREKTKVGSRDIGIQDAAYAVSALSGSGADEGDGHPVASIGQAGPAPGELTAGIGAKEQEKEKKPPAHQGGAPPPSSGGKSAAPPIGFGRRL